MPLNSSIGENDWRKNYILDSLNYSRDFKNINCQNKRQINSAVVVRRIVITSVADFRIYKVGETK